MSWSWFYNFGCWQIYFWENEIKKISYFVFHNFCWSNLKFYYSILIVKNKSKSYLCVAFMCTYYFNIFRLPHCVRTILLINAICSCCAGFIIWLRYWCRSLSEQLVHSLLCIYVLFVNKALINEVIICPHNSLRCLHTPLQLETNNREMKKKNWKSSLHIVQLG